MFLSACDVLTTPVEHENPDDNPIDPDNPEYVPPLATITVGPVSGSIIDTDEVMFCWCGNTEDCLFSYKLNNNPWSPWDADTTVSFNYLDELDYLFQLKASYPTGSEQAVPETVTFTVDAIEGPALWLYHKKVKTTVNDTFSVYVVVEEVNDLAMAAVNLNFNPEYLQIQSYEILENDSVLAGKQVIQVDNHDNDIGKMTVYLALVSSENASVSGTGSIIRIVFRSLKQGITEIEFDDDCYFRKADNTEIPMLDRVNSLVEIE